MHTISKGIGQDDEPPNQEDAHVVVDMKEGDLVEVLLQDHEHLKTQEQDVFVHVFLSSKLRGEILQCHPFRESWRRRKPRES